MKHLRRLTHIDFYPPCFIMMLDGCWGLGAIANDVLKSEKSCYKIYEMSFSALIIIHLIIDGKR